MLLGYVCIMTSCCLDNFTSIRECWGYFWIGLCESQKILVTTLQVASWIHGYFDNVMTKFMINNMIDALKTDAIC